MTVRDLIILGCSSQQPTRKRNQSGYLLRWNEEGFLFDPGEGTQRQFIFADVAPTVVNRIFVSHFHGDHCLGLGSMLMRLNLDKVTHPIHCYYPASGKVYFDRLRYGTIYHENINVIEHPVEHEGIVDEDERFIIEARFLEHGVQNIGWRITEKEKRKFDKDKVQALKLEGPKMRELVDRGFLNIDGKKINIDEISSMQKGLIFAVVIDTLPCKAATLIAQDADLLLCESTYLESHKQLARKHHHLTAKQAAKIAKEAGAKYLILTHYSARYADLDPFIQEAQELFPHVACAEDFKRFDFPIA
jgi:ribonuclease Z